jgi:hypothetical protein
MIGAVGLPSAPYCPREVNVTMPATDMSPKFRFEVSENAYNLCHPDEVPEPAETTAARQVGRHSAMEFLALNPLCEKPSRLYESPSC